MGMIDIIELLSIYKEKQIDEFLKKYTGLDLNEPNLTYEKIKNSYKFLGDNESNGSNVSQLTTGEKGVVERITNAIDAVIENERQKHGIRSAKNSGVIIRKAFPNYYNHMQNVMEEAADRSQAKDADGFVTLAVNDGSRSNKPTIDIVDKGTGLFGHEFEHTILSINNGNKLSSEKSYLIGAFGQGGSTSLPFTYATIILSKKKGKFFFTVIKRAELMDYKNSVYVYLTMEGKIPEVNKEDFTDGDIYINEFVNNAESGTLIRMIESEISKKFRDNDVTKPGMLIDYLNTELFNVGLPVKIIDNREQYKENFRNQNRNVHGSLAKLKTFKYVAREYSGSIDISHMNQKYDINFYVLLPTKKEHWGSDYECSKVFEQFNVTMDPIIYIVNGQTITTERHTKLGNAGLNFLRHRLLVVINLDDLGREKYQFFTADRSRIMEKDLTRGFLDKVVSALAANEKLREINSIIGELSVSSSIDKDFLDDISREVKNRFSRFLKTGTIIPSRFGRTYGETSEEVFEDHIAVFEITTKKRQFYKDENIVFFLTTKAHKKVNERELIYMYVDDSQYYNFFATFMNGRIQYTINANTIKPGMHSIEFSHYKNNIIANLSEKIVFEVLNEKAPETQVKSETKELDLKILVVEEDSLICDVSKNEIDKEIIVKLCLDGDLLKSEVYGISSSSDEISMIKNKLIKPISLFSLFYLEVYNSIEKDEEKNDLMISFIRSFLAST